MTKNVGGSTGGPLQGARSSGPDGLVVVDKPAGWTSHDVVARLRRLAHTRRVGHAGTLDPMATGVLVVGVGAATRLLHHLVLADKAYEATIRLGQYTVTDDAEGEVTGGSSAANVELDDVRNALRPLTGDISQVPSSVSAIRVDGQRAYKRVRDGESPQLPPRPVTVARFDALGARRPTPDLLDVDVRVECSSGTYIRALARDLGAALGSGGHLTMLRRTRVGPFTLAHAADLDILAAQDDPVGLSLTEAIRICMPIREINDAQARELSFGRALDTAGIVGVHGAVAQDGTAVALLLEDSDRARPVLVFPAAAAG